MERVWGIKLVKMHTWVGAGARELSHPIDICGRRESEGLTGCRGAQNWRLAGRRACDLGVADRLMAVGDRSDLTSWQAVMDGMIGYTCKAMIERVFGAGQVVGVIWQRSVSGGFLAWMYRMDGIFVGKDSWIPAKAATTGWALE